MNGVARAVMDALHSGAAEARDRQELAGAAGVEPAATGLEGRCSIQLSYAPDEAHSIAPDAPACNLNLQPNPQPACSESGGCSRQDPARIL